MLTYLPAGVADLDTSLADVHGQNLGERGCKKRESARCAE